MRKIETLRARIAALQVERAALLRQKRNRAQVVDAIGDLVQHWAAEGADLVARELQRAAEGGPPDPLRIRTELGPLFAALLGADAVRAALLAGIEAIPVGLDATDRADKLVTLGVELDRLEKDEERLCEAEGIDRRPDARPEIVLA